MRVPALAPAVDTAMAELAGVLGAAAPGVLLAWAVAVLVLYALWSRAARRVVFRCVLVAVPIALLVAAGYRTLPPTMLDSEEKTGRVIQALVAGGAIALGWVVTFAIQEMRNETQRREAQRDLMVALRSELRDFLDDLGAEDPAEEGQKTVRLIRGEGKARYVPFVASGKSSVVFDALSEQIHLLPQRPLERVAAFYIQLSDVRLFSADLQRQSFADLPTQRRALAYEHLVDMKVEAETAAVEALEEINRALRSRADYGINPDARARVIARRRALSSSSAGRTGPPAAAAAAGTDDCKGSEPRVS